MNKITSSSLQFQPPKLVLVWILHLLAKIICNFNFVDCKTQNSVAFVVAFLVLCFQMQIVQQYMTYSLSFRGAEW